MLVIMAGEAMLTAALPVITDEFSVPGTFESWVLPMVLLIGAAVAPFIGIVGDQYGRRKILLICLFIYLFGLICGFFSQNIWILLFSRAMQGVGIASFPLAYALVRNQLSNRDADVGIGIISATYGAGTFLGVILGSFIIEFFTWRMTYIPLIPTVLILIFLTSRYIHDTRPVQETLGKRGSLDWYGLCALILTLLLGLTALSIQNSDSQWNYLVILSLSGAIIGGYLFTRHELRTVHPFIDLHLVFQKPVLILISIGSLTIFTFLMFLQEMPFLIQSDAGLGLSVASVGLILMPGTLCDMLAGPITGRLVVSRGVQPACIIGSLLLLISVLILLPGIPSILVLTISWMIFSAGMSMTSTACIIAMIDYVPRTRTAEATGLMQSVQTIGGMVGPVITGIILSSALASQSGSGYQLVLKESAFITVHSVLVLIAIIILCFSIILYYSNTMFQKSRLDL